MGKLLVNDEIKLGKVGILKESIYGMSGKGHVAGTEVRYIQVGDHYVYTNDETGVVVRTVKLCV